MRLAPPAPDAPPVEWALFWAARGWRVFPMHPASKDRFYVASWQADASADPTTVRAWWQAHPDAGIGGTPPAGWVAVDSDPRKTEGVDAIADWPATLVVESGRGDGGVHRFYSDPQGTVRQHQGKSSPINGVDTRVAGKGYTILPPSIHPDSGQPYRLPAWTDPVVFPYELWVARPARVATKPASAKLDTATLHASLAAWLQSEQHDYDMELKAVSRLAGLVARGGGTEAEFKLLVDMLDEAGSAPDPDKVHKFYGLYDLEKQNQADIDEKRGWLLEAGHSGYSTPIDLPGGKVSLVPWSDFRVETRGRIRHVERQIWLIDLVLPDGTRLEQQLLPSETLSSTPALRRWLMGRGCTLYTDRRDGRGVPGERLLKLMQSQDYDEIPAVSHYGWHPDLSAFVGPQGTIIGDQVTYPDPALADAGVAYGTTHGQDLAVDTLAQVLTFQDETVCAVAGAWLMMVLLKGRYDGAMLPGLVLQGHSGSGKTEFARMLAMLSGTIGSGGHMTSARMKNLMPMSGNSVMWLDDSAVDATAQDLLRTALTGGAYYDQGGADRQGRKFLLRMPVLVSNEGMASLLQKAMRDRTVTLELPFAQDRPSLIDPSRPQWQDVLALRQRFNGDLTQVAGSLVQAVYQHATQIDDILGGLSNAARTEQAGAVLRVGARVLALVTDNDRWPGLVAEWWGQRVDEGMASVGIQQVIPAVWRTRGFPTSATNRAPVFRDPRTELFHVNVGALVAEWAAHPLSRREDARDRVLISEAAITKELSACGAGKSKATRTGDGFARYREIPERYSRMIFKLATE